MLRALCTGLRITGNPSLPRSTPVFALHGAVRLLCKEPAIMHRAEKITFDHIGSTFLVHSGREHNRVHVSSAMVNHRFGDFVPTRTRRPRPKAKSGGKK